MSQGDSQFNSEPGEPEQFLPPVLGFDELYLHPSEESNRVQEEYKKYLVQLQDHHRARSQREYLQGQEAAARTRQLNAEQAKSQAEANAIEQETRRANEAQSTKLKDQQKQLEITLALNKELNKKAEEATQARQEAETNVRQTSNLLRTTRSGAIKFCLIAVALTACITGFSGFHFGYSQGFHGDLEAQLSDINGQKNQLENKVASLQEDVKRLTPAPPPDVDSDAVQTLLLANYKKIDAAHNQENRAKLFSYYDPHFIIETGGFKNNLAMLRATTEKDFFRDDTLHQQVTELDEKAATVSRNTAPPASATSPNISSSSSSSPVETTKTPVLEVIDKDTVVVPVLRTIYTWKHVSVPSPAVAPTSDSASSESSASSSAATLEKSTSTTSSNTFEDKGTEFLSHNRETWKRIDGHWLLSKTEVSSVSASSSIKSLPTLKCHNISCGKYYYNGVENHFEDRHAVKTCPNCFSKLFFPDDIQ